MNRSSFGPTLRAALSMVLLAACASAPSSGKTKVKTLDEKLAAHGYKLDDSVERIVNWNIDGWNYIDESHVVFTAGPSRDYLVTVVPPCSGLSSANTIGFTSTVSTVTRFDKLIVRNTGFTDQCPISELHELKRIKKAS